MKKRIVSCLVICLCVSLWMSSCEKDNKPGKPKPDSLPEDTSIIIPKKQDSISVNWAYFFNTFSEGVWLDGFWLGAVGRHFFKEPVDANFHATFNFHYLALNGYLPADTVFKYTVHFNKDSLKAQYNRFGGYRPSTLMYHLSDLVKPPKGITDHYRYSPIHSVDADSITCDNPRYTFVGFYWTKIRAIKYVKKL